MTKKDYIKLLETIATYMELQGANPFKISAYRKAAASLERLDQDINEIEDFTKLDGIGKSVASVLLEFQANGESSLLNELKVSIPEGLIQMLKIRNLGAKKIVKIHKALQIDTIEQLTKACENHEISTLPGFGKTSEANILKGIQDLLTMNERMVIYDVMKSVNEIDAYLNQCNDIDQFEVAGSYRRMNETSKDIDYIISTKDREKVSEYIQTAPFVLEVELSGNEKITIKYQREDIICTVDFRFTDNKGFAHMLQHFTGSKDHNIKIRQLAKQKNEKISEYGITQADGNIIQYEDEASIYRHFNVNYIPPMLRTDGSEFDFDTSQLIHLQDIKGDLHMHTTYSDGAHTLEQMIEANIQKGYEYMVITDHSKSLFVANGLPVDKLLEQNERIKQLNEKYSEIDIYSGIEMDILPDGSLDYPDEVLSRLDYVIAAIHQSLNQPEAQIMERLKVACENPYVRHIAHPTGRILGRRGAYQVNVDALIQMAKETNTYLELNANPMRLDLNSEILLNNPDLKITINTDAHHVDQLNLMKFGVGTAIKGRVNKDNVLNTLSRAAFKEFIMNGK
ncbi:DNA polymerase/3'-5' exonuclease PolX [Macrococcus sp. DPC7161]|uniref:DNA polymerase/3'-5' exonuclease PolX n=1 Tax=Macrococcus sp. DPC7161 TaxID=2507060 RepID=UPI00100B505F|nr:DNA polymerase/3'-5' exonuclease PolX [Macrococcus sp. DPC7161]RXK18184.1 DNA polymerase/3'-5' exonuclease PolX [Macrococcus sp. DPC7161]